MPCSRKRRIGPKRTADTLECANERAAHGVNTPLGSRRVLRYFATMKPRELLQPGESGIGSPPLATTDAIDTRIQIDWLETEAQPNDTVIFAIKTGRPVSSKEWMWHGR